MLQPYVNRYPAIGTPGQHVAFGQGAYTPENYLSDGTVKAGAFAFDATPSDSDSVVQFGIASATGERLLGFVERVSTGELPLHTDATEVYAEGEGVTIAIEGDYYMVAPSAAEVGQSVLCSNGEISFGDAGSDGDTGWTVARAGAAGDTIIISKH